MDKVEKIARHLCLRRGFNPEYLEPGDLPQIDGKNDKNELCHFKWREFTELARELIELGEEPTQDGRYYHVGGEICQNCNKTYKTIHHIPDDIWKEITRREDDSGLLCIECIDRLASLRGYKLLWEPKVHPVYREP